MSTSLTHAYVVTANVTNLQSTNVIHVNDKFPKYMFDTKSTLNVSTISQQYGIIISCFKIVTNVFAAGYALHNKYIPMNSRLIREPSTFWEQIIPKCRLFHTTCLE